MIIVYKNHHAIMYDHSLCVTLEIYTRLTFFATTAFSETSASFQLLPDYTVLRDLLVRQKSVIFIIMAMGSYRTTGWLESHA